jgi:hypothetical protein
VAPADLDATITAAINNASRLWISIREIGKVRRVATTTLARTIEVARNAGCIKPSDRTRRNKTTTTLTDTALLLSPKVNA